MNPDENSDWEAGVREYKEALDKLQISDAEAKLKKFLDELNAVSKGKVKIYAKEAVAQEKFLESVEKYELLDQE